MPIPNQSPLYKQTQIEEEKQNYCPEDYECTICSESLVDNIVKERMNYDSSPKNLNAPDVNKFEITSKKK